MVLVQAHRRVLSCRDGSCLLGRCLLLLCVCAFFGPCLTSPSLLVFGVIPALCFFIVRWFSVLRKLSPQIVGNLCYISVDSPCDQELRCDGSDLVWFIFFQSFFSFLFFSFPVFVLFCVRIYICLCVSGRRTWMNNWMHTWINKMNGHMNSFQSVSLLVFGALRPSVSACGSRSRLSTTVCYDFFFSTRVLW